MESASRVSVDVRLEPVRTPRGMAAEVRRGLLRTPKRLPSKYFYDERGSRLFERITDLPEYYLTRAEVSLLGRFAPEIMRRARAEELLELGAGLPGKVRLLLDAGRATGRLRRYVPVDASRATVESAARTLALDYPDLEIHGVVCDFERLARVPRAGRRLGALLGSTIGNFARGDDVAFLSQLAQLMERGDRFLLGVDLVKDRALLEAAYNDAAGVTAEFNRNILHVLNRELEGDFDPAAFEHVAFYNESEARIESYLRSVRGQRVRLAAIPLEVEFAAGELLWTEVSCKYTRASVEHMLAVAGRTLDHWFADDTFALAVAK